MPRMPRATATATAAAAAGAVRERVKNSNSTSTTVTPLPVFSTSASYSSSLSSTSNYPSSCSSISPPRNYYLSTVSPPPRPSQSSDYHCARDHLASLIKKHGPPTPVSSTSSLRRLTSTSPTNPSYLPPLTLDTPPASPPAVEPSYVSTAGSRPIPIPRANLNRSLDDLPLTPLTGRFDHGLYLSEHPSKHSQPAANSRSSRNEKTGRKKKSRPTASSTSPSSSAASTSAARSHYAKDMSTTQGHLLTMSSQAGQVSPKKAARDASMYLGNLPRFHPAVYQSPNSSPNPPLSPSTPNQSRSFAYRVSSGGSRDALRQYRELVASSVSLSYSSSSGHTEISAPRLDPLGSPGPVTPLALEEADNYMAVRPEASHDKPSHRQSGGSNERDRTFFARAKDVKGR